MRKCPACSATRSDSDTFCADCGARLAPEPKAGPMPAQAYESLLVAPSPAPRVPAFGSWVWIQVGLVFAWPILTWAVCALFRRSEASVLAALGILALSLFGPGLWLMRRRCKEASYYLVSVPFALLSLFFSFVAMVIGAGLLMGSPGRPFRRRGRAALARLRPGDAWIRAKDADARLGIVELNREEREQLAQAWLEDARVEHASVAAFSRLSLQLLALGAPPELLRLSHQAALDEIEHAGLCLEIARGLGAEALEPGALPEADPARSAWDEGLATYESLAIESWRDGVLNEGLAAEIARRAASEAAHPRVAQVLERVAEDERRHAELGWEALRWAVRRLEPARARALAARLRGELLSERFQTEEAKPEFARGWGRLGAETLEQARERVLAAADERLLQELSIERGGDPAPSRPYRPHVLSVDRSVIH